MILAKKNIAIAVDRPTLCGK